MEKKVRLFYLDFIRAIATILIVIFHFNTSKEGHLITENNILFVNHANGDMGTLGVSLFFIISGAALMYTYQQALNIKEYVKKRVLSIYPMFWIAWILSFLYLFYSYKTITYQGVWTFLLTVFGFDGYLLYKIPNYYILGEWFLGCIILFYMIFPLLRKAIINAPPIYIYCNYNFVYRTCTGV